MRQFHKDGTLPPDGWIFVFGSNLAGRHGAGAAKVAAERYGAVEGFGIGSHGDSYAIPTKNFAIDTLDLHHIARAVASFLIRARRCPSVQFWVTRIGCGLAGYRDEQIAPMFERAPDNCSLPEPWRRYVEKAGSKV